MEKIVTPFEPTTNDQIGILSEKLADRLRRHNKELPSDIFQQLLSDDTLIDEMYSSIYRRIEPRTSFFIARIVKVNRNRSLKQALKATGRNVYIVSDAVKNVPKAKSDEVEIILFKLGCKVNITDLCKEYELRNLKPVDPYSHAALNEADPAFSDEYPNFTYWQNKVGKYSISAFYRFLEAERTAYVYQYEYDLGGNLWFAGVRKSSSDSDTLNS